MYYPIPEGKVLTYVQSYLVSLADLFEFLFDLHGQLQSYFLYSKENKDRILDRSAGGLEDVVLRYCQLFTKFRKEKKGLTILRNCYQKMIGERVVRSNSY